MKAGTTTGKRARFHAVRWCAGCCLPAQMRWLAFIVALFTVPTEAAASSCYLGPFLSATELPVGCPIVVYAPLHLDTTPIAFATRDNTQVDITGEVERELTMLTVGYPEYACDGTIEDVTYASEEYALYRVEVRDPTPGETVIVAGYPVNITEAGACPAPVVPAPSCAHIATECRPLDESDGGGCQTSGNSFGGAAALVLLALVRRRRRQ